MLTRTTRPITPDELRALESRQRPFPFLLWLAVGVGITFLVGSISVLVSLVAGMIGPGRAFGDDSDRRFWTYPAAAALITASLFLIVSLVRFAANWPDRRRRVDRSGSEVEEINAIASRVTHVKGPEGWATLLFFQVEPATWLIMYPHQLGLTARTPPHRLAPRPALPNKLGSTLRLVRTLEDSPISATASGEPLPIRTIDYTGSYPDLEWHHDRHIVTADEIPPRLTRLLLADESTGNPETTKAS